MQAVCRALARTCCHTHTHTLAHTFALTLAARLALQKRNIKRIEFDTERHSYLNKLRERYRRPLSHSQFRLSPDLLVISPFADGVQSGWGGRASHGDVWYTGIEPGIWMNLDFLWTLQCFTISMFHHLKILCSDTCTA